MGETEDFDQSRKRLWDELVHLHDAWDQYRYLFTESEERIKLLNACARWFFGVTQRLLLRETVLGISRLTDPVTQGRHSNLVLGTLLTDPNLASRPDVRMKLETAISEVVEAAEPIRAHRNKYIAHLDHATAVGSADEPLPGLARAAITGVIEKMGAVYNLHGGMLRDSFAVFELSALGSAKALVKILEQSERWAKVQEIERRRKEDSSRGE